MASTDHRTNINFVLSELLPEILDKCTTSELLELRLVNRHWKKLATLILLKRDALKIEFELRSGDLRYRSKSGITFYAFKKDEKSQSLCDFHWELDNLTVTRQQHDPERTLPDLFRVMTSAPVYQPCASYSTMSRYSTCSLPVRHFAFHLDYWSNPDKTQPQLLSFVQTFGPNLRSLTLDSFVHYFVGQPGMPDFVLQYTPNLEFLHIYDKRYRFDSGYPERSPMPLVNPKIQIRGSSEFTLPNLKFVKIEQHFWSSGTTEILSHLLEISPNLQQVYFPILVPKEIFQVIPPSKINLLDIDSLQLGGQDLFSDGLENLENLVRLMIEMDQDPNRPQGVGLRYLDINVWKLPPTRDSWNRVATALRQIFELYKNFLEIIELTNGAALVLHQIPGLPALPKVTHLFIEVAWTCGDVPEFTPCKNSLSALFPNVDQVDLWLSPNRPHDGYDPGNLFPFWGEELNKVKTHTIRFHEDPGNVLINHVEDDNNVYTRMFKICPEATSLSAAMWHDSNFPVMLKSFWSVNLSQLTDLHLEFSLRSEEISWPKVLDLDATLTGLSTETVVAIYNNFVQFGQWDLPRWWQGQPQVGREKSSLLNLTNLKKLQLDFKLEHYVKPMILVSGVSAQFAFDLMPNLEVFVLFKVDKSWADCPACGQQGTRRKEELLELHQSLLAFPRVNVAVKSE